MQITSKKNGLNIQLAKQTDQQIQLVKDGDAIKYVIEVNTKYFGLDLFGILFT